MTVELSKTADGDKNIDGRYQRFKKSLGKGSFKHVYEAFDIKEQKDVAWNMVDLSQVRSDSELDKIKKETNILKSLQHRNILRIHDTWINEQRDKLIFITDIMRDGSLLEYIIKRDITLGRVKEFSKEILNALEYLHQGVGIPPKPVIHRDLKCDNIFIDASINRIVLGDLGLSTSVGSSKTSAGQSVVGTPEFMAPEMFEEKYDEKVDIYAFGMCVIQMVTKKYPYQECRTLHQVYKKITKNEWPEVLSTIISKSVRDFIQICCAFESEKRPTAGMLRHHPFLNYSYPTDQLSCSNELIVGLSKISPPGTLEKPTKTKQQNNPNRLARIDETESKAFVADPGVPLNNPSQPAEVKKQQNESILHPSTDAKAPQHFTFGAKSGIQNSMADRKAQISKVEEYEGAGHLRITLSVLCKMNGHLDNRANFMIKNVSFDYNNKRGEDTPRSIAKEMVEDLGLTPKKEMLDAIEEAMADEHINAKKKFIPSSMASVNDPLPKLADSKAAFKKEEIVQSVCSTAQGSQQNSNPLLNNNAGTINISQKNNAPMTKAGHKPTTIKDEAPQIKICDSSLQQTLISPQHSHQSNAARKSIVTSPEPRQASERISVGSGSSPPVESKVNQFTKANPTLKKSSSENSGKPAKEPKLTVWHASSNPSLINNLTQSTVYPCSPSKAVPSEVSNGKKCDLVFCSPKPTLTSPIKGNFLHPGSGHTPPKHITTQPSPAARINGKPKNNPFVEYDTDEGNSAPISDPCESSLGSRDVCTALRGAVGDNPELCTTPDGEGCTVEVIPPKVCQGDDGTETEPGPVRSSSIRVELPISPTQKPKQGTKIGISVPATKKQNHTTRTTLTTGMASETPAKLIISTEKKEQDSDTSARLQRTKRSSIAAKISTKEKIKQQIQEEKKKLNDDSLVGKDAERAKTSVGSLSKSLVKSSAPAAFRTEESMSPHASNSNLLTVPGRGKPSVTGDEDRGDSSLEDCKRPPTGIVKKTAHLREEERKTKETIQGGDNSRKAKDGKSLVDETPSMETSPDLLNDRNPDAISIGSPRSLADEQQRIFPYNSQTVDADHDGTVIGSGDESQGGRTTPGGHSSFLTESKQPPTSDSVTEFNLRAKEHLQSINKKLDEKRKKVMNEYRERLEEIDDYMDFRYKNLKKKTKDPKLQEKIEGLMSEFKQQFQQMKLQSEKFEKSCGLVMPSYMGV